MYPEVDDSYYTANNGNNDYDIIHPNEYDDNDLPDLMFPYSTKSPPPKANTYMPINPDGTVDGENEVRFNEKVASYGLDYHP